MGLNDRGLCVAGTAAYPKDDKWQFPSIGLYMLAPIVLSKCDSVSQAVELTTSIETICEGGNLMLCDTTGEMVVLEIAPPEIYIRESENDVIVSTNFYASGRIEHRNDPEHFHETTERYKLIHRMLADSSGMPDERIREILATHDETSPVCRHQARVETVLSWIALPLEGKVMICGGHPCNNEYRTYTI